MAARRWARWAVAAEVLLIAVLLISWTLAWLANVRPLENYSPAGRSLFLTNWFTVETLWPSLLLGVIAICALPLRHRSPLATLVVTGSAVLALEWFYPLVVSFSVTFALKAAVLWAAWKLQRWWVVGAVVVPVVVALGVREFQVNQRWEDFTLQVDTNSTSSSSVISMSTILEEVLFFAVVVVGGLVIRRVVEQRAELEERNRELIVERGRASEAAVSNERLRISRELHDVVAHHVTTMTVHAGASRQLIESNPEAATESLLQVESSGRMAVSELHQLLGFLRNADSGEEAVDRSPTPSLRHLTRLQDSLGSKVTCEVEVEGDLSSVPSAVDVSAYRIIQEAFTNTMKHSHANRVTVHIEVKDDELSLMVRDDGPAQNVTSNGQMSSGGHGLVGMRERASLHNGQVQIGPDKNGNGWLVSATLPFGGSK